MDLSIHGFVESEKIILKVFNIIRNDLRIMKSEEVVECLVPKPCIKCQLWHPNVASCKLHQMNDHALRAILRLMI